MDKMRKAYVMPLPVVDETYKPVGIVTTRDILGAAWLFLRILIFSVIVYIFSHRDGLQHRKVKC
ncbi:MAG: hypothetical protein J7L91_03880 [Candidatus Korarchaeota archaeon]|nr:hypothetical protein [Candidatus Korarchaeota archaeon]